MRARACVVPSLHFTDDKSEAQGACPFHAGNERNERNKDTVMSSLFSYYTLPTFYVCVCVGGILKCSFIYKTMVNGDNKSDF